MGATLRSPPISQVELLSVLEVQIPTVRAAYQIHAPLIVYMTEWDRDALAKFDTGLRSRSKASRTSVDNALRSFAHAALRSQRLKDIAFDASEIDLFMCQMLVSEFAHMKAMFDNVLNTYQMPYKVLCDRVISRSVSYAGADDLHLQYGVLNQAIVKFSKNLQTCQELSGRVLDYQPFVVDLVGALLALSTTSTDAYNALIKLNNVHHRSLEFVNRPLVASH